MTPAERTLGVLRRLRAIGVVGGRRRRIPNALQPDAIRLEYFKRIRAILARAKARVDAVIVPQLAGLVAEARRARGDHLDAGERTVDEVADEFFETSFSPAELEALAREFAARTSGFQKAQLDRQARAAMGSDPFTADPDLVPLSEAFVKENVALIKSVPRQYFSDIERTVAAGVRAGTRHEDIARQLAERYGVAEDRARLIARDQVGKFYGDLNRVRQRNMGVTHYIWRSSRDNRVRLEHRRRNGQRFAWASPPEDGHPGHPVNCRCNAEPDFDDILNADKAAAEFAEFNARKTPTKRRRRAK